MKTIRERKGAAGTRRLWRVVVLALGDLTVFMLFALIGLRSHESPLAAEVFLRTVAPLAASWFLLSPSFGIFNAATTVSMYESILRVTSAWLVCGLAGLLARS